MEFLPFWLKRKILQKAKEDAWKEFLKENKISYSSFLNKYGRFFAYIGSFILALFCALLVIIINFILFNFVMHLEF